MWPAPGDFFLTQAAADFGRSFNDNSIRANREYASSIYAVTNSSGVKGFSYSIPNKGTIAGATPSPAPSGSTTTAYVQSHGAYSFGAYNDNNFSGLSREYSDCQIYDHPEFSANSDYKNSFAG